MKKSSLLYVLIISIIAIILAFVIDSFVISPILFYPAILAAVFSLISLAIKTIKSKLNSNYFPSFYIIVFLSYIINAASTTLITGFTLDWSLFPLEVVMLILGSLVFSILYTYIYFLPYITSVKRTHPQARAIYILNFFVGWTIIAWIIALIWANTAPKEKIVIEQKSESNADELKKYKELLDGGIITQEEFDAKKKQLLGL